MAFKGEKKESYKALPKLSRDTKFADYESDTLN